MKQVGTCLYFEGRKGERYWHTVAVNSPHQGRVVPAYEPTSASLNQAGEIKYDLLFCPCLFFKQISRLVFFTRMNLLLSDKLELADQEQLMSTRELLSRFSWEGIYFSLCVCVCVCVRERERESNLLRLVLK